MNYVSSTKCGQRGYTCNIYENDVYA